ncbi:MAG: trxA [Pedosphaera sp.]|nr:trxA [Pedosphaera sp.]
MKKLMAVLLMAGLAVQVNAAEWLTDLPKALEKAKTEKKLVMMEFTGSDWCPPCKALHKNVMTSPEFEAYASTNLVLVELDFPHKKEQSAELKKSNAALAEKYKIEGYPTVIVLDENGKELSKDVGYGGEKPEQFIEKLKK